MTEHYALDGADEQLQALLDRAHRARDVLRGSNIGVEPHLLSAGAIQYAETILWYSLTASLSEAGGEQLEFELEISTDMPIPERLYAVCAVGRSRVDVPVRSSMVFSWRAQMGDVLNKRTGRVDTFTIALEQRD